MNSNAPLDHAHFQLSPRRTRCELFVSAGGKTEKLASGFLKPFVTHLKVAEEQASRAVSSIRLEVGRNTNASTWFNKGTVERFVRFISTPEILEIINTLDAEMSQLEGAKKIYSLGAGDPLSGGNESKAVATADITKKELVRAIDVRLVAVKQDLATACARAAAAGFDLASVSELLLFADQFGSFRLSEACMKFLSVCQQRPDLFSHHHSLQSKDQKWKNSNEANLRSSSSSDMSIDGPEFEQRSPSKSTNGELDDAQLHSLSTYQLPYKAECEAVTGSIEQQKHDSQSLIKKEAEKIENSDPSAVSSVEPVLQPGGGSRRLSVQDRINLFESKQKEHTVSTSTGCGSSNGAVVSRLVGARGEHRRNASDISVEKSVLRRWSGASDMSIDLSSNSSNDRKESCNTAGTPTSSIDSLHQYNSRSIQKKDNGLTEVSASSSLMSSKSSLLATLSAYSSQDKDRTFPSGNAQIRDAMHGEVIASASVEMLGSTMEKEQACTLTRTSGSVDCSSQGSLVNQVLSLSQTKDLCSQGEAEPAISQINFRHVPEKLVKNQMVSQISSSVAPAVAVLTEPNQAKILGQPTELMETDGVTVQTQVNSLTKLKPFTRKKSFAGAKPNYSSSSEIQVKASLATVDDISAKAGTMCSQTIDSAFYGNQKESIKEIHTVSHMLSKDCSAGTERGCASQEPKFPAKTSGNDQSKNFTDERVTVETSKTSIHRSKNFKSGMEAPTSLDDKMHTNRSKKGNHEVNGVLQMKADELEKLFAEHRLRIDGDQTAATRRSKIFDDHGIRSMEKIQQSPTKQMPEQILPKYNSGNEDEFDFNLLSRIVENFDISDANMQMSGDHTPSDDSRGKLYGKYMQKREAKLREEYEPKRAQNEAKMKAMHDSLDLSQAEMKAKSSGSFSRKNFTNHHVGAEKIRSFNDRLALKNIDQMAKSFTSDGFDDEHELSESSTGNQSRKLISNKTVSSRTSVSPTPKHSLKSTNSGSLRRRVQTENAVAQSVPNFSEFKNENIKPSIVISKASFRGQPKSFARSKSSVEDVDTVKEEKSRRFPSTRKCSTSPVELNNLPFLNSGETLNKVQISNDLDQSLKKEHGMPHGLVAVVENLASSKNQLEVLNNEKHEEMVNRQENSLDLINDDEGFEKASIGENNLVMDPPVDSDSEKPRRSLESGDLESENGDVTRLLSQRDDPSVVFPKFNSARNAQDSPDESSGSWNSRVQHLLSYTQEASDFDASVDSPTGSPASWNSHPLNQMMDSESARMRKKWGNAQVPVIVASSSSRKDVTKGFKRLLKFGRKSRGAEYLISDWVSVSTASEGDDDQEDGRDLVPRPLDDIRKSRMGSDIAAYDGLNDGDVFPERAQSLHNSIQNLPANLRSRDDPSGGSLKAPRSFFSLSSFRSKASESRLR